MNTIALINKVIKPDLAAEAARLKKCRNACVIGIILSFVSFGACGPLCAIVIGVEFLWLLVFPFAGFIYCGVSIAVWASKAQSASIYLYIRDSILAKDKTVLCTIMQNMREDEAVLIINRLMETGNLPGYKLINNVIVAKEELYISDEEALEEHNAAKLGLKLPTGTTLATLLGGIPAASQPSVYPTQTAAPTVSAATVICHSCNKEIPSDATYCPYCGVVVNFYNS